MNGSSTAAGVCASPMPDSSASSSQQMLLRSCMLDMLSMLSRPGAAELFEGIEPSVVPCCSDDAPVTLAL